MASLLNNFDDESVLLLYLADELLPSDRQAMRSRLASDAGLAAKLDELRAAQTACAKAMAELDSTTPLPIPASLAAQRVGAVMRQHAAGAWVRPRKVLRPKQRALPSWTYPLAAAACMVIAVTIWGVYRSMRMNLSDDVPTPLAVVNDLTSSQMEDLIQADDAAVDDAPALDQAETVVAQIQASDDASSLDLLPVGGSDKSELTP